MGHYTLTFEGRSRQLTTTGAVTRIHIEANGCTLGGVAAAENGLAVEYACVLSSAFSRSLVGGLFYLFISHVMFQIHREKGKHST